MNRFDLELQKKYKVRSYIHKAKAMLNYNNIKVGESFDLEISHHKGIKNFEKIGCFLFNIVNKQYAKKILGKDYLTATGIRADEKHRISKKDNYIHPLADMNFNQDFIFTLWELLVLVALVMIFLRFNFL